MNEKKIVKTMESNKKSETDFLSKRVIIYDVKNKNTINNDNLMNEMCYNLSSHGAIIVNRIIDDTICDEYDKHTDIFLNIFKRNDWDYVILSHNKSLVHSIDMSPLFSVMLETNNKDLLYYNNHFDRFYINENDSIDYDIFLNEKTIPYLSYWGVKEIYEKDKEDFIIIEYGNKIGEVNYINIKHRILFKTVNRIYTKFVIVSDEYINRMLLVLEYATENINDELIDNIKNIEKLKNLKIKYNILNPNIYNGE